MGELGMLTLDNGVTLQYSLYMGRCTAASPQEQSTEYIVSQSHSFSLSSLHHHTHSLCSATRVNYFIFFIFSFVEQFTLPCSQPTTLASIRGMGWSLGSLQFCHLNTPSPPTSSQQGVLGEQPLLLLLQAVSLNKLNLNSHESKARGRGRDNPSPLLSCLTRSWDWQCVVSLT